jgi:diguanylate cyclase (GGDEF)-like protein
LPGHHIIESYFNEVGRNSQERDWALLYIDINHFQSYNQLYGYQQGDEVLAMVADLLRKIILGKGAGKAFVGHDGRDDFVALLAQDQVESTCKELVQSFDEEITRFYPQEHRDDSYQVLVDRQGGTQLIPRLNLSIGVVTGELCDGLSYLEIRQVATDVVNCAKAEKRSSSFVNRRHLVGRYATHAMNS